MPRQNTRTLCLKLLGIVLAFLSVFFLSVTFAGYASQNLYLEITTDYRPYTLAFGILDLVPVVILWRSGVWRRLTVLSLGFLSLVIVVNGWEVLPWLLAHRQPVSEAAGTKLKTIAFNIEGNNVLFEQVRNFIRGESPDVAMFCEAQTPWPSELKPLNESLPHHVRVDAMDIEIFSRHPIVHTQIFHFGPERGFVVVGLKIETRQLNFVATHTYPRFWRGAEGFQLRSKTLEEGLGKQLSQFTPPTLIMGDFNASPWSPAYKNMMRTSGYQDGRKGFGILVTQHGHGLISRWLWRPIDHCLHSEGVRMQQIRTGPDLGSDHLPVIAELVLPPVSTRLKNP